MENELLNHLDLIHTTELGVIRIKRNASITVDDVVKWCKDMITKKDAFITRKGKNYYITIDNYIVTINAYSYTIITVHKKRSVTYI